MPLEKQVIVGAIASGTLFVCGMAYIVHRIDRLSKSIANKLLTDSHLSNQPSLDFSGLDSLMHLHSSVCNDRELNGLILLIYFSFNIIHVLDVIERIIEVTYKLLKAERISMMILSKDKKKMTVVESKDMVGKEISIDDGIAAHVARTGSRVNIKDAYQDPRFNPECDKESEFKTKSILCAPIIVNNDVVGVITAINKLDESVTHFSKNDEFIIEYVASNAGIAIKKAQLYNQAIRHQRNSEAVLSIVRARSSDESVEKILSTTIDAAYNLLMPEMVSVFLCDHMTKEAWVCVSKDGLQGMTVPFGHGVAGTVAETGRTIRIDNAYKDVRFLREVDTHTGFVTKSILCVAVPGFANEKKPIAVIQLINKLNGRGFDEDDEEALTIFCLEVSTALRRKILELNLLRFSTFASAQHNCTPEIANSIKLEESLLQEYGSVAQRFNYSSMIRTKLAENKKAMSSELDLSKKEYGRALELPDVAKIAIQKKINCWDLDPFETKDSDLLVFAESFLEHYDLINRFKIDLNKLRMFLSSAHMLYHSSNAFHNFKHGWSVMHMTFLILRSGVEDYLTLFDILGLLIAAMCHDLDHPGNNNAFEVMTRSQLALNHSDDSVLERHHASMLNRLLAKDDCNIFCNLTIAEQTEMRVLMTDAILATDMTVHFFHVQQLEDFAKDIPQFDIQKPASRRKLIGHVIHTADISGQLLTQELALKWGDGCVAEFRAQSEKEKSLGLPVTAFMSGLESDLQKYRLQLGFINNIAIPLWTAMAECFPNLLPRVKQGASNSNYYSNLVDELEAASKIMTESAEV